MSPGRASALCRPSNIDRPISSEIEAIAVGVFAGLVFAFDEVLRFGITVDDRSQLGPFHQAEMPAQICKADRRPSLDGTVQKLAGMRDKHPHRPNHGDADLSAIPCDPQLIAKWEE
jgi:hypothetical protein